MQVFWADKLGDPDLATCITHPGRETSYACMKYKVYLCEDCLNCRDPEIYCKFRTACPIHFLTMRKGNLDEKQGEITFCRQEKSK